MSYCEVCFEKQQKIDTLSETVLRLKAKLYYQERNAKEKPFGANTPSSKINHKTKSTPEKQKRQGGAKKGHQGHGRCCDGVPDETIDVPAPENCPDCGQPVGLTNCLRLI